MLKLWEKCPRSFPRRLNLPACPACRADGVKIRKTPFFCQTHLSAFLKGGRPPVQFRRSQSQSVAVIISLKWRDHPPSQHLPGVKPLKGRVKEGRKISDYFFGSATVPVAVRGVSRRTSGQRRVKVSQSGSMSHSETFFYAKINPASTFAPLVERQWTGADQWFRLYR